MKNTKILDKIIIEFKSISNEKFNSIIFSVGRILIYIVQKEKIQDLPSSCK